MQVPNLPDEITHDQYVAALNALGIPPHEITKVTIHPGWVEVDAFARDAEGKKQIRDSHSPTPFLKHRIEYHVADWPLRP